MKRIWPALLLVLLFAFKPSAKLTTKYKLEKIIARVNASVGIAVIGIETHDSLIIHNDFHYPTQSVYKFPLAMHVLDQVDRGKLRLDQKIHVAKTDLPAGTWSPLHDKFPEGNIDVPVAELLEYAVSKSDNNVCDILFRLVGGPVQTQSYIKGLGIDQMAIAATEEEMRQHWGTQYTNWTTPYAMASLLQKFYHRQHLSDSSSRFLMHCMTESSNSSNRIKALLPKEAVVAHKTGTSDNNGKGMYAAINDVGIVTLPNGNHFVIAVLVSNTTEKFETNEKIIAQIARTVYDDYVKNGSLVK